MGTKSPAPKSRSTKSKSSKERQKKPDIARAIRALEVRVSRHKERIQRLTIKQEALTREVTLLARHDRAEATRRTKAVKRLEVQLRILKAREQDRLGRAITRFASVERSLDQIPFWVTVNYGTIKVTEPGDRWWKSSVTRTVDQLGTKQRRFSQLIREGRTPHDQRRFEKARLTYSDAAKTLASAKQRHEEISKLIAKGKYEVPSDTRLPTSILNLIDTRDSLDASTTRTKLRKCEARLNDITIQISLKQSEITELLVEIEKQEKRLTNNHNSVAPPPSRLLMQWSDAEVLAHEYCRWLGYQRTNLTGEGTDGGVDIEGPNLVAQVKMHNRPTGRPEIQQLYGIAASSNKRGLYFAMSYSSDALEWADKVGVRLYQFERDGTVRPIGSAAKDDAVNDV
jgi:hypothetical protein